MFVKMKESMVRSTSHTKTMNHDVRHPDCFFGFFFITFEDAILTELGLHAREVSLLALPSGAPRHVEESERFHDFVKSIDEVKQQQHIVLKDLHFCAE